MKVIATLTALTVLVGAVSAEEKDAAKFDAAKLEGKWEVSAGTKAGVKVEKPGGKVTIAKNVLTLETDAGKFVMSFKVDAAKSPAQIDFEITEDPFKGSKALGLIAMDKDEVTLAYVPIMDPKADKRPEKLESTKDNKAFLFTLKPVKK